MLVTSTHTNNLSTAQHSTAQHSTATKDVLKQVQKYELCTHLVLNQNNLKSVVY